jgi:pimeloyl-ACP methyl ester carboxylesterase
MCRVNVKRSYAVMAYVLSCAGAIQAQTKTPATSDPVPKFVEVPCTAQWGTTVSAPRGTMKCGTVTVPQNRSAPNDPKLMSIVLPVIVYAPPSARGTPLFFLAGGPGESSIESVQRVFFDTPTGQSIARDHPVVAFDRRGYSPTLGRSTPDLGTVMFQPRGKRELAIAPLRDSLKRRGEELRKAGIDPRYFTTLVAVEDVADVARALHYDKVIVFGVSYGTHESLLLMKQHPKLVEMAILDGVAPPSATQVLDSAYMTVMGRSIIGRIVTECANDKLCAAQYGDLAHAVTALTDSAIRRTVQAPSTGDWRTVEVQGASVLSVLGIAASAEEVLSNVPRAIMEFAGRDTLSSELSPRVLIAAAIDPSLQTVATQAVPLVRFVALCADRPKGEPKAGDRRLCDALGVPFDGPQAIEPVTSDIPTLLLSSGFDAQTPMELAVEAGKTLSRSQHVNFPTAGHVAVARPLVSPCVALIVDSFMRAPDQPVPSNCAGRLMPAFMPPEKR